MYGTEFLSIFIHWRFQFETYGGRFVVGTVKTLDTGATARCAKVRRKAADGNGWKYKFRETVSKKIIRCWISWKYSNLYALWEIWRCVARLHHGAGVRSRVCRHT